MLGLGYYDSGILGLENRAGNTRIGYYSDWASLRTGILGLGNIGIGE